MILVKVEGKANFIILMVHFQDSFHARTLLYLMNYGVSPQTYIAFA